MKVLWLASWYPNRLSPFNGDFIKRHAEAVSLYANVQVVHVIKDKNADLTKDTLKEEFVKDNLRETICYYYSRPPVFSIIGKFFSERKYRRVFKRAVQQYINENGKPDMIHVHVGMKAGSIALWAKRKWKIPYVVSEHWSGFLEEATEKFSGLPGYLRLAWKNVLYHAKACSAVSHYLANAIQRHFHFVSCKMIPNVVDTKIFSPAAGPGNIAPRFIHVSGLDAMKNPALMLKAFQVVLKQFPEAGFEFFGSEKKDIINFANSLNLQNNVRFYPEIPQPELAEHVKTADALILYSSYETFGCVIIEANACGIPVIVSDIPVFHETVREGENGYFVPPGDPAALAEKMINMIKNRSSFNNNAIAADTKEKYSYPEIGKQFFDWYQENL